MNPLSTAKVLKVEVVDNQTVRTVISTVGIPQLLNPAMVEVYLNQYLHKYVDFHAWQANLMDGYLEIILVGNFDPVEMNKYRG